MDDRWMEEVAAVADVADPLERAAQAHALVTRLAQVSSEASRVRREALGVLEDQEVSRLEIAKHLGITRTRVGQLVRSGPNPERALLSHDGGPVIIALGSKQAEVGGTISDMISRDAAEAHDALKHALDAYDVGSSREIVPAPGLVDLNRDRLITLGSPKVLPVVGQILASDPHLGFASDDTGRYLLDRTTDTVYRSPQDSGEEVDYAYLGRLPRPDGKGSFLYLAGLHAAGTHGAARYLIDHAPELYRAVKGELFSLLVKTVYKTDEGERVITGTEALTQTYVR